MKVYLIAPKNTESFWTFDRVSGLMPPSHEVVLWDENVESVDVDTDAAAVGVTDLEIHTRRSATRGRRSRLPERCSP